MIAWQRTDEPFCAYCRRRLAQRQAWLVTLYARAANEHSRRLVDRLAKQWGMPVLSEARSR